MFWQNWLELPATVMMLTRQKNRLEGFRPREIPIPFINPMTEIIFEVLEDEIDGGYTASALGFGIATQANSLDELRANVREAVDCHFGDGIPGPMPKIIRLHFVRDELLAM